MMPIMRGTKIRMAESGPAEMAGGSVLAATPTRKANLRAMAVYGTAQALGLIAEIGGPSLGSNRAV